MGFFDFLRGSDINQGVENKTMNEAKSFDAVIIGFGKGGKTLAGALGNAGKKTALIEKSPMMYGGTCINVGCIPTKFLVHRARDAKYAENKAEYYAEAVKEELALTEELRGKNLAKAENAPNVTVITGTAKLISNTEVEIVTEQGTEVLTAKQIFLNTGSVPVIPPVEGIQNNPYVVTSEALLKQTKLPGQLVIIGGGYIGVEFASLYADFGSKVTIIQNGSRFLPREDADIADAVRENLASRGVELLTDTDVVSVTEQGGRAVLSVITDGAVRELYADTVLVATGRKPNTKNLGLENAGVDLTARGGVVIDEHLKTTAPNIYAMGDVVGGLQFTYISLDDYRIVRSAVLGDGSYTTDKRGAVPYSVFLNPPFSRVGMSEQEAKDKGYSVKVAKLPAAAIPKALVVEQPAGMLKAIIDEKTGLILGAHLFCEESHEIINTVKLAMDAKLPYTVLRDMVFTHPTMSEAFNDLFNV